MAFDYQGIQNLIQGVSDDWLRSLNLAPDMNAGPMVSSRDTGPDPWLSYMLGGMNQPSVADSPLFANLPSMQTIKDRQSGGPTTLWPDPSSRSGRPTLTKTPMPAATTPEQTANTPYSGPNPEHAVTQWSSIVQKYSAQYGVPVDVALAIIELESHGNPGAESQMNVYNGKPLGRAQGLMQVLPGHFGQGPESQDPSMRDPEKNIQKGMQILADNFKNFGNWDSAVAAYYGAVDAQGNPTTASDYSGVTGKQYVQMFHAAQSRYRTGG